MKIHLTEKKLDVASVLVEVALLIVAFSGFVYIFMTLNAPPRISMTHTETADIFTVEEVKIGINVLLLPGIATGFALLILAFSHTVKEIYGYKAWPRAIQIVYGVTGLGLALCNLWRWFSVYGLLSWNIPSVILMAIVAVSFVYAYYVVKRMAVDNENYLDYRGSVEATSREDEPLVSFEMFVQEHQGL